MNKVAINSSELKTEYIPILTDEEAKVIYKKGWSFFNVYSLRELRDIYIIYRENVGLNIPKLFKIVDQVVSYDDKVWSERRVLENINALKNIKFIDQEGAILKYVFENRTINSLMTNEDLEVFQNVFFSYFRFKELSSWFISPEADFHYNFEILTQNEIVEHSRPVFYFSDNNRFTDTFLYDITNISTKYIISDKMTHLMRFWDVFIKWGTTLKIVDKFNLSALQTKTKDQKEISIAYFVRPFEHFDLMDYIRKTKSPTTRNIFIPELIFGIAKENRYSVNDIKFFLINQIKENDKFTYERTSEIFIIKGKQSKKKIKEATYLYPIINDSYVSHLVIRK